MKQSYLPSSLQSILYSFAPCFTAPSFENFVALVCGWMLCQGAHTVTRAFLCARLGRLTSRRHHASLHRFLSRARWAPDALGRVLLLLLLPFLGQEIEAAVDDTLCRRTGAHIFGAGMHHDTGRSTYRSYGGPRTLLAFGHSWVVLSLWVSWPWKPTRGTAIPILFRLYRPKKHTPEAQYRKRTELAVELLRLLASWLPEGRRLNLAADREYSCTTVLRDLPENVRFVGTMPMDAALFEVELKPYRGRGRRPAKGPRLPTPTEMAAQGTLPWSECEVALYGRPTRLLVHSFVAIWYSVTRRRPLRVVLTRDPSGRMDDRVYFSTHPQWSAQQILRRYARRWALEVTFFHAKQSLGLEQVRNGWWRRRNRNGTPLPRRKGPHAHPYRGRKAAERTVPLLFLTYGLVVAWYLRHGKPTRDVARECKRRPWDRGKSDPSFPDMLHALRREFLRVRISADPLLRAHREKLSRLLPIAEWAA